MTRQGALSQDDNLYVTEDDLDEFIDLLNAKRSEVEAECKEILRCEEMLLTGGGMDEADQASQIVAQNMALRRLERSRKFLKEIDRALAKVKENEYGICEGTGEPIPKKRLRLAPWARHSVKYKAKLEEEKKIRRRGGSIERVTSSSD